MKMVELSLNKHMQVHSLEYYMILLSALTGLGNSHEN